MGDTLRETALKALREDGIRRIRLSVEAATAHIVMLCEQGVTPRDEARPLLAALRALDDRTETFDPLACLPDELLVSALRAQVGSEALGWLRVGCGREDKAATVERLFARGLLLDVFACVASFCDALIRAAQTHSATMMPVYLHFRHAQPGTLGHHYMRLFFELERDLQRLEDAYKRVNLCPLGGVNGSGTALPIDRRRVAALLGMNGILENAADCTMVCDDFSAELTLDMALVAQHVARLAADLFEWSSYEYRIVEVADEFAGSSTLMPQKKNPTGMEGARSYAGQANGWMASTLGALKTGSSFDNDLYHGGSRIEEAAVTCQRSIRLVQAVVETLIVYEDAMARQTQDGWSASSALVEALVLRGYAQSEAMCIAARLVANAQAEGIKPANVTVAMLNCAAGLDVPITQAALTDALSARHFLDALVSEGNAGRTGVMDQATRASVALKAHRMWLEGTRARLADAQRQLAQAAEAAR